MSRSFRHTPVIGITCAESDKPGKVIANRTLRRHANQAIASCTDFDELVVPVLREVSSVWSFPKDGKQWLRRSLRDYAKYLRK